MKKLLLSILTLSSLSGFSQWVTTGNNTSGDVFSAFGVVLASDPSTSGLYSSSDNGATWSSSNTGVPAGGLRFGTMNAGTVYAFGNNTNTIYQSTTGNNWTLMTSAIGASDVIKSMAVINGIVVAATCPVSGSSFRIWKLSGTSWVAQSAVITGTLVTVIRDLNGTLFAGTTGTMVIKSTDNGVTFSNSSTGLPSATAFDKYISALGSTPTTLFTGSEFGKIFKSVNAGANWTPAYNAGNGANNIFINDIYVRPSNTNHVLIATDSGFVYSQDGGSTWAKNNSGLTYSNYEFLMKHITVVGTHIVASVNTAGPNPRIMRRAITEIFSGIKENYIEAVQSKAYPNPANGNVTIEAGELIYESNCEVRIADVLGNQVGVYKMNEGKAGINLQNFAQGLYSYQVFNENIPVSNGKLIIE